MFTPIKFFWAGLKNLSLIEAMLLIFDISIFIIAPRYLISYYLWAITLLCDLGLIICHGAWLTHARRAKPVGETVPWQRTEGLVMRFLMFAYVVGVILFTAFTGTEIVSAIHLEYLSTYCWYLVEGVAIYELFYSIMKTMNAHDPSWLEGTKGRIGIPNAISVIRIALALCVPHIYAAKSFGAESFTIASIILGIALGTDAIDGYLARSMNQTTKAGKALDPLGDKLIFYPVAVGFYLAAEKHFVQPLDILPIWLAYVAAGLIILRDILIIIWFFLYGKNYRNGISAGYADKIRTIILSAWLVSTALAITVPETSLGIAMVWISWITLLLAGIASPISFVIDIYRIIACKNR